MTANRLLGEHIRKREILDALGVSGRTLDAWVRAGRFPKPIRFSRKSQVWKLEEVRAALAKLQEGSAT